MSEIIVEEHLDLVHFIINKYFGGGYNIAYKNRIEVDDLFQIGCIGLIKASKLYDPNYGTKFSTYASNLIINEILFYLERKLDIVKIPRQVKEIARNINKNNIAISSPNEVIEIFKCSKETADAVYRYLYQASIASLNAKNTLDEDGKEVEIIEHIQSGVSVEDEAINKIDFEMRLNTLSDRDRQIIKLVITGKYTQLEIGNMFGVSQVQVSRITKKFIENKPKRKLGGSKKSKKRDKFYKLFSLGLSKQDIMEELGINENSYWYFRKIYFEEKEVAVV